MSRLLIRFSLWAVLAAVLLAFARERLDPGALKTNSGPLLYTLFVAAVLVLAFGLLMLLIEKVFSGPGHTRCAVCRKRIIKGEMYCREHLRQVIVEEEERARHRL